VVADAPEEVVNYYVLKGLYDVAREASFETKESGESRNGFGGRWSVVARGWRRIRGGRWSDRRYADGEHRTRNYSR
jgi:hypothetical protein